MSLKLLADLKFGEESEDCVKTMLEAQGYEVTTTSKTALTDFFLTRKVGRKVVKYHAELKTRKVERGKYEDTIIGGNKLWEAWNLFYKEWVETLFLFKFTDWLFSYNPIQVYRTEFKSWRWWRGFKKDWSLVDEKKGWLYINNKELNEQI